MSTKVTAFYIDTDLLYLHLFDDLAGSPGLSISINSKPTTQVRISNKDLEEIIKCIKEQIKYIKQNKVKKFRIKTNLLYLEIGCDLIVGLNTTKAEKFCPTNFPLPLLPEEVDEVFRQILEENNQLEIWGEE